MSLGVGAFMGSLSTWMLRLNNTLAFLSLVKLDEKKKNLPQTIPMN